MIHKFKFGCLSRIVGLLLALPLQGGNLPAADNFPEPAKIPSQTGLPDPLVMMNGERVTTREQWVQQRRPELKALFQHYMYGTMPAAPAHLDFTVERVDNHFFGGKATKKEVTISFDPATN